MKVFISYLISDNRCYYTGPLKAEYFLAGKRSQKYMKDEEDFMYCFYIFTFLIGINQWVSNYNDFVPQEAFVLVCIHVIA